jgi:hypothetical protein
MKINSILLALCLFHPNVWRSTAFFLQAPQALKLRGHKDSLSPTTTFAQWEILGNLLQYIGMGESEKRGKTKKEEDDFVLSEVSLQKLIQNEETKVASKKAASSGPTVPKKRFFATHSIEKVSVRNKEKDESSFPPSPVNAWKRTVLMMKKESSFPPSNVEAGIITVPKKKKESSFPWSTGKAVNLAVPGKKESGFPLPTFEAGKPTVPKKKESNGLQWPFEPIVPKNAEEFSYPLATVEARKPTVLMKKESNGVQWPFGSTVLKKAEESSFPLSTVEAGKPTVLKKKESNGLKSIANALEKAASSGPLATTSPKKGL